MTDLNVKLAINSKIDIMDNGVAYRSIIQDVKDKYVIIDTPLSGSKYYMMHVGSKIEFFACINKDVYKFRSTVLGKRRESSLELIILSMPELIEKIQRREFFRLPVSMEIKYFILPEKRGYSSLKDVPSGYFQNMIKTYTMDISGGGIRIVSKQSAPRGCFIILTIPFSEDTNVLCSVVRCEEDKLNKNYKLGLRFEGLDEKTRDKIIRFIFMKSREQSKLIK